LSKKLPAVETSTINNRGTVRGKNTNKQRFTKNFFIVIFFCYFCNFQPVNAQQLATSERIQTVGKTIHDAEKLCQVGYWVGGERKKLVKVVVLMLGEVVHFSRVRQVYARFSSKFPESLLASELAREINAHHTASRAPLEQ
jgi:hypothetical protein